MLNAIKIICFYLSRFFLVICLICWAAAAFLIAGGIFGIVFGGVSSIELFGITIVAAMLGDAALKLGLVIGAVGGLFFVPFVVCLLLSLYL